MADVPHKFTSPLDEGDMYVSRAASLPCRRCGRPAQAATHQRWNEMASASRQSASSLIPRVHG